LLVFLLGKGGFVLQDEHLAPAHVLDKAESLEVAMVKKDGGLGLWIALLPAFGAMLLSWAAFEIAFLPILRPNRGGLDGPSLDPKQGNADKEAVETSKSEEVEISRKDSVAPPKQG
jgi:hypothetical protein